ncbi:lipocalin family protein [Rhodoferax sp.]|uniref:lipocalin family protein n=1 Tax=Rhodoferax sp. TaxID=50421 RepID=UPI0025CEA8F4|nr:lipocalin family protein [Rhodoferax sp.]MCM2342159.1 lipocalin family protein [Rhodoferax sp.]
MKIKLLVASLGLMGLSVVAQTAPAPQQMLSAIATLDVPRYLGSWYEIAKYPNSFQRKCVANTQARYSLLSAGQLQVVNRCRLENGETSEAIGAARQQGDANSPKLKVRFAPAWLSFIPAVWGDYWVIDLDPAYQLAAVAEPKREYLWILSRTPKVDSKIYQALLERLTQKGFDISKLENSPQQGD